MNKIFGPDTAFANFMNALAKIIWIGLLWLVCSLPVITAGAASAAAYYATVRVLRKKRGYATGEFFQAFKANFKLSLPLQLILVLIFCWLFFDIVYLYGYGTDFARALSYILYMFTVIALSVSLYLYPCLQRYDERNFEIFKLAVYFTFRHLLTTIGQLVLFFAALLGVYLMPWSILIIPGLWWYAESFLLERVLSRYGEGDEEEEDSESGERPEEESRIPGRTGKLRDHIRSTAYLAEDESVEGVIDAKEEASDESEDESEETRLADRLIRKGSGSNMEIYKK